MKEKTVKNVMAVGGAFASLLKLLLGLKNSDFFFKFNKKAFTLAEVLVTLTIIGVVSSMTIPTLHQRHTEQATIKKVQKFYSTMFQAYQRAVSEHGDVSTWGLTGSDKASAIVVYDNFLKDNFKIIVNCETDNSKKCFSGDNYYWLNGNNIGDYYSQNFYYKMILNDGSLIWIRPYEGYFVVYIDVNGHQKPNKWGIDVFDMLVSSELVYPLGIPNKTTSFFDDTCNKASSGFGCAAWLVYKGNMDYLHCDDLSWNGKQKCGK